MMEKVSAKPTVEECISAMEQVVLDQALCIGDTVHATMPCYATLVRLLARAGVMVIESDADAEVTARWIRPFQI